MSAAPAFPTWLPWLLGFLTAIGPASIDMYLPAFGAIEAEFGASAGSAQVTLAAYFAGLAVLMLAGSIGLVIADRFRPALARG